MNLITFKIDEVIINDNLILIRQDKCTESFHPDQVYSIRKGVMKVYEDEMRKYFVSFDYGTYDFRKIKGEYYYVTSTTENIECTLPMYVLIDINNRIWVNTNDIKPLSYWLETLEMESE